MENSLNSDFSPQLNFFVYIYPLIVAIDLK